MKSFVISKRDAGTRVDRFIEKTFESVPKSLMYKEIRKKNIKVNKKRCTNDQKLNEGDLLELYLKDDVLKLKVKHLDFMKASDELDIVYEDENVIIIRLLNTNACIYYFKSKCCPITKINCFYL